eukprot:TRINITY_DN2561_c0_g1_i2.p1 TRINITY_DN2561_c0_g1~~TRINITY_DN2561_c0_g1_i2.p1  ORF type:complete len:352 (+),score=77.65 TRINITY_DN2561_c0_g1_i2:126-1058(+)
MTLERILLAAALLGAHITKALVAPRHAPPSPNSGVLAKTASFLSYQGLALESTDLTTLAKRASIASYSRDPHALDNVKNMLRRMIESASLNHAELTTRAQFCKTETASSQETLASLNASIEKSSADLDLFSAQRDDLKDSSASLRAGVVDIQKKINDEAQVRAKEHDAYAKNKAEYEQSGVKRIHQVSRSDVGEDDDAVLRNRIVVETAEAGKRRVFERHQREAQVTIQQHLHEADNKDKEALRKNAMVAETKRELDELKEQLELARNYADKLSKQCVVRVESGKERHLRREAQISSLKDAYEILSGDAA